MGPVWVVRSWLVVSVRGRLATEVSVEGTLRSIKGAVLSVEATMVLSVGETAPSVEANVVPSVDATVLPAAGTVVSVLALPVSVASLTMVPAIVSAFL